MNTADWPVMIVDLFLIGVFVFAGRHALDAARRVGQPKRAFWAVVTMAVCAGLAAWQFLTLSLREAR